MIQRFIFSLIIFITSIYSCQISDDKKEYMIEYKDSVHGVIERIVREDPPSSFSNLSLTNGRIYSPAYTNGLWVVAKVGDSIAKSRQSNQYIIFQHSAMVDTIHFDFSIESRGPHRNF